MRYKRIEDGEKIIYCTDQCKLYVTTREQEYQVLDEIEKEECYCAPEKKAGSEKEPARLKKLIILMTSACNLRCRYCYLNYGKYDGGERTCNIKVEDAQKAIDIIFEKYPEGIGFIQFFGGEPLVAFKELREIYNYIIKRCLEERIEKPIFGMVTNGLLLNDEIIDFLNESSIRVTLSIDGGQEVHDLVRLKENKTSAFADIVTRMEKYKERIKFPLFYEMTLNREHVQIYRPGKMREWLDTIKELGFHSGIMGVVEFSMDKTLDLREEDIPILKTMYEEYVEYYFEELKNEKPSFFNLDICRLVQLIIKGDLTEYCCNAGVRQLTLAADGTFYPCPKFAAIHRSVGSVEEGYFEQSGMRDLLKQDQREGCQDCWMRYMCKSYCYAAKYRNIDNRKVISVRCIHLDNLFENVIRHMMRLKDENRLAEIVRKIQGYTKSLV